VISALDQQAAHSARTAYHLAAERHSEHALSELALDRLEPDEDHRTKARYLARLALLLQKVASTEYEVTQR
jgi:hypothetical protein